MKTEEEDRRKNEGQHKLDDRQDERTACVFM